MNTYQLAQRDCIEWLRSLPSESVDLSAFGDSHPLTSAKARNRFAAKVAIGGMQEHCPELGECHVWNGAVNAKGYGHFAAEGKVRRAHVVAWEIANAVRVPAGMVVMHLCDNRRCVNPAHLRVGTPRENSRDMLKKGRQDFPSGTRSGHRKHPEAFPHGEQCKKAKLTDSDVRLIRGDQRSARLIAAELGVSHTAVLAVRRGVTWRHVQ